MMHGMRHSVRVSVSVSVSATRISTIRRTVVGHQTNQLTHNNNVASRANRNNPIILNNRPYTTQSYSNHPHVPVGTTPSHPLYVKLHDTREDRPPMIHRIGHAFKRYFAEKMGLIIFIVGVVGGIYLIEWYFDEDYYTGNTSLSLIGDVSSNNRFPPERPTTRLTDVVGCDEAKAEVVEVIQYLKNPEKFNRLGGKMPKGVLLLGPPGTGKTLLARAIAGEAGVPFFAATGSDFEEMFVGVGAKRVRELFSNAKKAGQAIIFIDEIDSVGGKRNDFENPKARMSLNQILTEMDGFQETSGIIVMGATNYAEKLDPAILRPGRFDRHVTVAPPDIKGRRAILDLYASKMKLAPGVDLDVIARGTPGMTGADLHHLLNSASLRASTLNKPSIDLKDLEYAKDKILMGAERTSAKNSEEIRSRVAVYQGGKGLTALLTPAAEPLHKVTVIQRGTELGKATQQLTSNEDKVSNTYTEYLAKLDVLIGGRVAEELIYGKDGVTTAGTQDLNSATQVARQMIMAYGYSDKTGVVSHARTDYTKEASGSTKLVVDTEVQRLLTDSYQRVTEKLSTNLDKLQRVAKTLLEHEVLDGAQLKTIVEGGSLPPPLAK